MENLVYKENYKEEIINGEVFLMSPSPNINHNRTLKNLFLIFNTYLKEKDCEIIIDGMDLHLSKNDIVIPDLMIVCNKGIIKYNGVYGAPSLVVEISSPSTVKRDKGSKKNLYEKYGIKEYWIVNPKHFSIEIYTLKEGKYILYDIHEIYDDYELENLKEEEKKCIGNTIKSSILKGLETTIEEVFKNVIKEQ